jgi:hypothetical protein
MTIIIKVTAFLILLFLIPNAYANAGCDVVDILEMYEEDDMSKKEIRNECGKNVSDAPYCSVRKVIRLSDDGYDEDEIVTKCSGSNDFQFGGNNSGNQNQQTQQQRSSNICQTPFMWCALGQTGPVGTPCWCNTGNGPLHGQVVPSN